MDWTLALGMKLKKKCVQNNNWTIRRWYDHMIVPSYILKMQQVQCSSRSCISRSYCIPKYVFRSKRMKNRQYFFMINIQVVLVFCIKIRKIFCAKCQESIQAHSICSSFRLLADESRDLSQAEKKTTVSRAEQIHKMVRSCHFD